MSGKFEAVFASVKLDVSWLLDGSGIVVIPAAFYLRCFFYLVRMPCAKDTFSSELSWSKNNKLFRKVGLEQSRLARYSDSIVSYVSDYGTEAKFVEARRWAL